VEDYGRFEAYSNRDSLKYRSVYGWRIDIIQRNLAGRFSKAWNMFVQLGMTDDGYVMEEYELPPICKFVRRITRQILLKLRHA
jgi:hypothetical protein